MSSLHNHESSSGRASPEKADSTDEKLHVVTTVDVADDIADKDEALKLVGLEQSAIFSDEYYAHLRRKLDRTIPPLCCAVYCTQYLDKTTLNYAIIMGFPVTGQHYNLVAMSFYIGFLLWVFPTMYISQRLRLGKYLGTNIVLWGIVMMLHSVPKSFGAFYILRLLLGMLECCVAPILILIISMFYKKDEQAQRISWFYLMNGVAGIFGGFIAYGLSFVTTSGFAPYRILYIVFGALAVSVGICVLLFMPDSPSRANFLSKEERIASIERIRDGQGGTENKKLKKDQLLETFFDLRTWFIVLTTILTSIPNGGLANFGSIIIKNFGYTSRQALILSTPGGAVGIASALLCGYWSDKMGERMLPIAFGILPTITGAAIFVGLNGSSEKGALLFGNYIIGFYGSSLAIIYAWNASNISGHTKKVTINALTIFSFAVGNIVGTETFLPKDAPGYLPGKVSILVLLSAQFFLCFIIRWNNLRLNRDKKKVIAAIKERNGWMDSDIAKEREHHAFLDLTDQQNPYFVYTA